MWCLGYCSLVSHVNGHYSFCYGRLAVVSDVDDGGVCPGCRQRKEVLPCYNKASTTERCWDQGGQDAHKVDECTE
jgi:hypothetical protein